MPQSLPIPEGEPPAYGAHSPGEGEIPSFAWPFDALIDLSGPAHYEEVIPLAPPNGKERNLELRIVGRDSLHYLFASVAGAGPMMQLSSGLVCRGARAESWHGVCSGRCVRANVLLKCALKFDGRVYSLDVRLQTEGTSNETLIFGNSSFECQALSPEARVYLNYGGDVGLPLANGANGDTGAVRPLQGHDGPVARPNGAPGVRTGGGPRPRREPVRPEAASCVRKRQER